MGRRTGKHWDRKWLEKKYADERLSDQKIAEISGVSCRTINYAREKLNVISIPASERIRLPRHNIELNDVALGILTGHLLGDGGIRDNGNISSRFYLTTKHFEYAKWVCESLKDVGMESVVRKRREGCVNYRVEGRNYPELKALRNKWYKPKKIVPRDIQLSSGAMLRWWMDDGSINRKRWPQVVFCTDCFSMDDLYFLRGKIREIGMDVALYRKGGKLCRLLLPSKFHQKFYEYIGKCPVECFRYKWPGDSVLWE